MCVCVCVYIYVCAYIYVNIYVYICVCVCVCVCVCIDKPLSSQIERKRLYLPESNLHQYRMPQNSMLGPSLFNLYTADVNKIAESFGIQIHCYADDVQLYIHCLANDAPIAVARLLACIGAIDNWIGSNKLKINAKKAQLI